MATKDTIPQAPWARCKGVFATMTAWMDTDDLLALRASCRAGKALAATSRRPGNKRLKGAVAIGAWRAAFPRAAHVCATCATQDAVNALEGLSSVDIFVYFSHADFRALRHAHAVVICNSRLNDGAQLVPLAQAHTVILAMCPALPDVDVLGGVHTLSIAATAVRNLAALRNVHTLDIACCKHVDDLSVLRGVRVLRVSKDMNFAGLESLDELHTLVARNCVLESLPHPPEHTLLLGKCPSFRDVARLGGLHTLELTDCPLVTDVTPLASLRRLNLMRCKNVVNVSALGGLDVLFLGGCPVEDVSALGGVRVLQLCDTRVTDVSALGGVSELDLSSTAVSDVSALGGVHTLILNSTHVSDVSALGGVVMLDISECPVKEVAALGGVHYVCTWRCRLLWDTTPLDTVCEVQEFLGFPNQPNWRCGKHVMHYDEGVFPRWATLVDRPLGFPSISSHYAYDM